MGLIHTRNLRDEQLHPELETTPDLSRGEIRLAGEVSLVVLTGPIPYSSDFNVARTRAVEILKVLAKG